MTAPTMPDTDAPWSTRAACAADPDRMYPEARGEYLRRAYEAAARMCNGRAARNDPRPPCPVRLECLRDGLVMDEAIGRHGMRAGLTPDERADEATVTATLRWLEQQRVRVVARA